MLIRSPEPENKWPVILIIILLIIGGLVFCTHALTQTLNENSLLREELQQMNDRMLEKDSELQIIREQYARNAEDLESALDRIALLTEDLALERNRAKQASTTYVAANTPDMQSVSFGRWLEGDAGVVLALCVLALMLIVLATKVYRL